MMELMLPEVTSNVMPRLVVRFKKFSQIRKWADAARRREIGDTTQSTEL